MTLRDHTEKLFFAEAPRALRSCAIALPLLGLAGGMGIALFTSESLHFVHFMFAILALVPAALCFALSKSVARKHISTVPLTILLCLLSGYVFIGNPANAAEGISPYLPTLIGVWIVTVVEAVAIVALIAFVLDLWRRGRFARNSTHDPDLN